MDAKTTGRFIAELRKQKGYTQKETSRIDSAVWII